MFDYVPSPVSTIHTHNGDDTIQNTWFQIKLLWFENIYFLRWETEKEDVGNYWITSRKREASGNLRMRHYVDRTLGRTRCGNVYGPHLSLRNQWIGYELFNGTLGISQYIDWNITLSSEQWNWKAVGESVRGLISGVGGPRKATKPSVRIDGVMAEIPNGNLPNIPTNQTPYWLSHGFSMVSYRL